ncbi:hypothetical protein Y694_02112 [Methylibium sp. T29-B]|uniref:hypothetical protein n=1 Tax=Methylibium sp. T29-B TaxID=1437443 RepID=UPI0003F3D600|nr:hypothetical protein [Methylibium sp. T29-B]EWS60091.1 hypothetical protein Y694_02112 [Methylibium sp. T29-B]
MTTPTIRTALLIDADNVKVELVAEVIERLQAAGRVLQHRRAYGSVQKATEFAALSQDHAIRFCPAPSPAPTRPISRWPSTRSSWCCASRRTRWCWCPRTATSRR